MSLSRYVPQPLLQCNTLSIRMPLGDQAVDKRESEWPKNSPAPNAGLQRSSIPMWVKMMAALFAAAAVRSWQRAANFAVWLSVARRALESIPAGVSHNLSSIFVYFRSGMGLE